MQYLVKCGDYIVHYRFNDTIDGTYDSPGNIHHLLKNKYKFIFSLKESRLALLLFSHRFSAHATNKIINRYDKKS